MAATHAPVDRLLRDVAGARVDELPDLSDRILDRLRGTVPEFFADEDVAYDMAAAVRANVVRFGEVLADAPGELRTMVLPHEAGDLLQSTIQHGIPLVSLLEAYRGAQGLAAAWWQERLETAAPAHLLARATRRLGDLLLAYIDTAAVEVRASYELERRALESSPDGRKAHLIRALLAGDALDTDAAARTLDHPLTGHHVGLVLWRVDDALPEEALHAALHDLTALAGGPRVLTMAARHRLYAWLSTAGTLEAQPLRGAALPAGVAAAMSGAHRGVDGFVAAHEDAVRTGAAVRDHGGGAGRVAAFEELELVTLLSRDPDASTRFVRRVLGPLADPTPAGARARHTLEAYLASGMSPSRTADHLGVHRNTVAYRVRALEEQLPALRGHAGDWAAFADRRLELELALRLLRG
ncbi:CdaR family transcriptional regulator [Conexibacter sp. SYSU D00693]|uniref:PucR family transcriptional regulator n=1 Tax=Conexibacter sp. SYSU D00693 TaxID=2812560 RepID=UPI00196A7440|nr:helix-turn-helix domain-containing protein [Conexibacter sp. SYSU D00693]